MNQIMFRHSSRKLQWKARLLTVYLYRCAYKTICLFRSLAYQKEISLLKICVKASAPAYKADIKNTEAIEAVKPFDVCDPLIGSSISWA